MKAFAIRAAVLAALLVPGVPPGICLAQEEYNAEITSIEIVKEMTPGEAYKVKVSVQNTGHVVWADADRDLELVCVVVRDPAGGTGGVGSGFDFRAYVADRDIRPGDSRTITGELKAPELTGEWTLGCWMERKRQAFGKTATVKVTVLRDFNSVVDSVTIESKLEAGQTYEVRARVRNTGKAAWNEEKLLALVCSVDGTLDGDPDAGETFCASVDIDVDYFDPILPGDTREISYKGTAPDANGKWSLKWTIVRNDTKKEVGLEATAGVEVAVVGDFGAEVVDIDIEKKLISGREHKVSVKVKNTGRSVWPAADFTVLVKHVERPANVPANCADLRATIELAEDLAPDAERVVTGRLTGSVYPGYWELSARVVRKKYGLGKERKVDVLVDCDMDAEMVSVRCDDATKMKVGRKYEFRVRVRNTGKTAWNVDLCELACRVLDTEWGDEAAAEKSFGKPVPLPKGEWVLPGEIYAFAHKVTAPPTAGKWDLEWQMFDRQERKPFGKKESLSVEVK